MIKRFLLLFCVMCICFSAFIVPALAAGITEVELLYSGTECFSSFSVNSEYPVTLIFKIIGDNQNLIYSSTPVTIDLGENNTGDFEVDLAEGYRLTYRLSNTEGTTDIEFFIGLCSDEGCYYLPDMIQYSRIDIVRVVVDQTVSASPASVLDVFAGVGSWVITSLGTMSGMFWTGSNLTFLGVLAVAGLALAVVILVVFVVSRSIRFRG